jgi:phospho-N-acetylmuramoyl-pentapeptide-transferase
MVVIMTPFLIRNFRYIQLGQQVREKGLESHYYKQGTPTMGGIVIVISILVTSVFWMRDGWFKYIMLFTTIYFAGLGFVDDSLKIKYKNSDGVSAKAKLVFQFLFGFFLAYLLSIIDIFPHSIFSFSNLPIVGLINFGYFYPFLIAFTEVGTSNAVNFADGLDGLATGMAIVVVSIFSGMSYIIGNIIFAKHLMVPYITGAGELTVFGSAVIGALAGFLWYNCYPATVFMGDTGSQALGGILATMAILIKSEFFLILVGFLYVLEVLSVIIQVTSFKLFKKRVFLMAPIHHHFEKKGWHENKVVVRFWLMTVIGALLGVVVFSFNVLFK